MNKKVLFKEFMLVVTTLIWGVAFVFQDIGGKYIDAYTFNLARNIIAALFLGSIAIINRIRNKNNVALSEDDKKKRRKNLILGGLCCGIPLALAMNLQQLGINLEGAGKSGFLTAIYIVFVPIFGLLFKKKSNILAIFSILIATIGLYLINVTDGVFTFSLGSILLLGCAITYSFQILFVDKYSPLNDSIELSAAEFLVAAICCLPLSIALGTTSFTSMFEFKPLISILFLGIMSSGVAYTLQIYGQKDVNATVAALIMSLESVFGLIFGIIIIHETHTLIQYSGCAMIFLAIILSQVPLPRKKKKSESLC